MSFCNILFQKIVKIIFDLIGKLKYNFVFVFEVLLKVILKRSKKKRFLFRRLYRKCTRPFRREMRLHNHRYGSTYLYFPAIIDFN